MSNIPFFIFCFLGLVACNREGEMGAKSLTVASTTTFRDAFDFERTDGWDFPVGPPDADGYYDAQPFGRNRHLGEDWNGKGGGNTDLGDPVFAAAHGEVLEAKDLGGGWGKVITLRHLSPEGEKHVSMYAHCDKMLVEKGQAVSRGMQLGTIGTANGAYLAHLHFEIREGWFSELGGGYGSPTIHLKPSKFINSHRPKR